MDNTGAIPTRISQNAAIDIAKQYAWQVRSLLDSEAKIYLFGSAARNEANENSDIDIAVISELFSDDVTGDSTKVNMLAYDVDMRINAQAISYEDWEHPNPFTIQIKTSGVAV